MAEAAEATAAERERMKGDVDLLSRNLEELCVRALRARVRYRCGWWLIIRYITVRASCACVRRRQAMMCLVCCAGGVSRKKKR